jgi:hypothetical protein
MERPEGSFECLDDDGNNYTVTKWQRYTIFTGDGRTRDVPGGHELRDQYGRTVNEDKNGNLSIFNERGDDIPIQRVG